MVLTSLATYLKTFRGRSPRRWAVGSRGVAWCVVSPRDFSRLPIIYRFEEHGMREVDRGDCWDLNSRGAPSWNVVQTTPGQALPIFGLFTCRGYLDRSFWCETWQMDWQVNFYFNRTQWKCRCRVLIFLSARNCQNYVRKYFNVSLRISLTIEDRFCNYEIRSSCYAPIWHFVISCFSMSCL